MSTGGVGRVDWSIGREVCKSGSNEFHFLCNPCARACLLRRPSLSFGADGGHEPGRTRRHLDGGARLLQTAAWFDRFDIRYVSTHCDGTAAQKAVAALKAYAVLSRLMFVADAPAGPHPPVLAGVFSGEKRSCVPWLECVGRPYVLHVHGSEFSKFYHEECGAISKWQVRRTLERAALLLAPFRAVARRAETHRARLESPDAAQCRAPAPSAIRACARSAVPDLVCRAHRRPQRHFRAAFAPSRGVAPRFPSATLVCAGDGEGEKLMQLASDLAVADRVGMSGLAESRADGG